MEEKERTGREKTDERESDRDGERKPEREERGRSEGRRKEGRGVAPARVGYRDTEPLRLEIAAVPLRRRETNTKKRRKRRKRRKRWTSLFCLSVATAEAESCVI